MYRGRHDKRHSKTICIEAVIFSITAKLVFNSALIFSVTVETYRIAAVICSVTVETITRLVCWQPTLLTVTARKINSIKIFGRRLRGLKKNLGSFFLLLRPLTRWLIARRDGLDDKELHPMNNPTGAIFLSGIGATGADRRPPFKSLGSLAGKCKRVCIAQTCSVCQRPP